MTLPEPEPQPRQVSVRGPLSDMTEVGTVSVLQAQPKQGYAKVQLEDPRRQA